MTEFALRIGSPADMEALGRALGALLRAGDVVTLTGTLGAGKTVLARGILAGLGFAGEVASPSFAIVHSYDPPDVRLPAAHIDFYRVEDVTELDELGLDDMLVDGVIIAEWPDKGPAWLRRSALAIAIEFDGEDARQLTVTLPRAWENRWPPAPLS